MSKITNNGLNWSGTATGCCTHIATVGHQRVKDTFIIPDAAGIK